MKDRIALAQIRRKRREARELFFQDLADTADVTSIIVLVFAAAGATVFVLLLIYDLIKFLVIPI